MHDDLLYIVLLVFLLSCREMPLRIVNKLRSLAISEMGPAWTRR